jgi:hypothetical protein
MDVRLRSIAGPKQRELLTTTTETAQAAENNETETGQTAENNDRNGASR